jgi:divalent metal cation (Fe/Co/Zn/Cd) transporter
MATTFEPEIVRSARRVSEISIGWSIVASTAAVVIGVGSQSAALVAFGAVGYVDMVGSIALVHHFRHAQRTDSFSDRFEQRAHRIVTIGLFSVGVAAVGVSGVRLVAGQTSDTPVAGVVLAAFSTIVLGVLASVKVRVGRRVPSAALRSDGHLSGIGATQAAIVLAGTAATTYWSLEWADNAAALVVGGVAIVLAVVTWRQIPAPD